MSDKCPTCGYYTLSCQCKVDNNYCNSCNRIISDCRCNDHNDHYTYGASSSSPNCGGSDARCFII